MEFLFKGVLVYKPRVVFAVINEICKKKSNSFFKLHESQQKQHAVYKLSHLDNLTVRYFFTIHEVSRENDS